MNSTQDLAELNDLPEVTGTRYCVDQVEAPITV